jgi:hypothetical protein
MKEYIKFGLKILIIIVLIIMGSLAIIIDLDELGTRGRMLVITLRILIIFPATLWYYQNLNIKK